MGQHLSKAESRKVGKVDMATSSVFILSVSLRQNLMEVCNRVQLRLAAHSPVSVFKFGFLGCWRRECEVGAEGDLETAKE